MVKPAKFPIAKLSDLDRERARALGLKLIATRGAPLPAKDRRELLELYMRAGRQCPTFGELLVPQAWREIWAVVFEAAGFPRNAAGKFDITLGMQWDR